MSSAQEYNTLLAYMQFMRDQQRLFDNIIYSSNSLANNFDRAVADFFETRGRNRPRTFRRSYSRSPIIPTRPLYPRTQLTPRPPPPPPVIRPAAPPPVPQAPVVPPPVEPSLASLIRHTNIPTNFFDPVFLYPSQRQIENSTTACIYQDISSNQTICPITRDAFIPTSAVLKINHCGHFFKENALRNWFITSSLCPVCRHDIRSSNIDNLVSSISNIISNSFTDPSQNEVSFTIPITY